MNSTPASRRASRINGKNGGGVVSHGDAQVGKTTIEYRSWTAMIARCEDPKNKRYPIYADRGIKICERWRNSYAEFLKDMGRKPTKLHSLDRINNDGNYEPENCRWATRKEQVNNRRPYSEWNTPRGHTGGRNPATVI